MEVKLESLIEKIKKDGLEAAEKQRQEIVKQAEQEASAIVAQAKRQSQQLIEEAGGQAEKIKKNGEDSLRQAARDLIIVLRQEINSLFKEVFKQHAGLTLDESFVGSLIVSIVDKWQLKEQQSLEVLVNPEQQKKISEFVVSALSKDGQSVEIKAAKNIRRGFMIGLKGDDSRYDFSDESIVESLKVLINPAMHKVFETR